MCNDESDAQKLSNKIIVKRVKCVLEGPEPYEQGDCVAGHFCHDCSGSCAKFVFKTPTRTDFCLACGHRGEGRESLAIVGEWLALRAPSLAELYTMTLHGELCEVTQ